MKAFADWIDAKLRWSLATFGPGPRVAGVIAHIREEVEEAEAKPSDLSEWADVILLALDGAGRQGYTGAEIVVELMSKQARNTVRDWPPVSEQDPNAPTGHVKRAAPFAAGQPDPRDATVYPPEHYQAGAQPCKCSVCRAVPTALVPRVDTPTDYAWQRGDLMRYGGGPSAFGWLLNPHAGGWHYWHVLGGVQFTQTNLCLPTEAERGKWGAIPADVAERYPAK